MKSRCKQSGFSLVELLIVIAIMAVLMGILSPVFVQARKKSQDAATLNQLRQIFLATAIYSGDFDTLYPCAAASLNKSAADSGNVIYRDEARTANARNNPNIWSLLLSYGVHNTLLRCPVDRIDWLLDQEGGHKATWFEEIGSSYNYDDYYALTPWSQDRCALPTQAILFVSMGEFHRYDTSKRQGLSSCIYADGHVRLIERNEKLRNFAPSGYFHE